MGYKAWVRHMEGVERRYRELLRELAAAQAAREEADREANRAADRWGWGPGAGGGGSAGVWDAQWCSNCWLVVEKMGALHSCRVMQAHCLQACAGQRLCCMPGQALLLGLVFRLWVHTDQAQRDAKLLLAWPETSSVAGAYSVSYTYCSYPQGCVPGAAAAAQDHRGGLPGGAGAGAGA